MQDTKYKEWFEANFLDGDKIQKGQMLSSEECFEAVSEALEKRDKEIDEILFDKAIKIKNGYKTELFVNYDEIKSLLSNKE